MRLAWLKAWALSFPRRMRHVFKHHLWLAEDSDGQLHCMLCNEQLTGPASWKEKD